MTTTQHSNSSNNTENNMYAVIRRLCRTVLQKVGWYRPYKLAFLGLDNAGKTTLLQMLKENHLGQYEPTGQPTSEELTIAGTEFQTFDLGGHSQARRIWRDYLQAIDAVVYLVDCADRQRFAESKAELDGLLAIECDVPVLVLGNKIDRPEAIDEHGLRETLGLHSDTARQADLRPVAVFMCSVTKRQGYGDGFRWLAQYINKKNRWLANLRLPF